MPGIADPGPQGINPTAIAAIGETTVAPPAVNDLTSALRSGFITSEDIRKRISAAPLEGATARQDLIDANTIRPLAREAAVGQLQSGISAQPAEAEIRGKKNALELQNLGSAAQIQPLLSEAGIQSAQQQLDNVRAHGNPEAIAALYRQVAMPLLGKQVPFDEKTGLIDSDAALKDIQKAVEASRAFQLRQFAIEHAKEQTTTKVDSSGKKTTTSQFVVPGTGQPISEPRVSETVEPDLEKARQEIHKNIQDDTILKPIAEADTFLRTANAVLNKPEPTNADDQILTESLIKLVDPQGVIRQSKIQYLESMTPLYQIYQKKLSHLISTKNAVLTPEDRLQIKGAVETIERGFDEAKTKRLMLYQDEAKRKGIPPENLFDADQLDILKNPVGAAPLASAAPAPAPSKPGQLPATTVVGGHTYTLGTDGQYHLKR